ncbi:MAG: hypothetical protein WBM59_17725 [Sedimenticolaceae bacterium]
MKATINFALFGLYAMAANALAVDYDLDLEPCINGDVSESGLFASQEDEDRFISDRLAVSDQDLEACINGDVSSSGLYSSQEAEDLRTSMPLAQSEN